MKVAFRVTQRLRTRDVDESMVIVQFVNRQDAYRFSAEKSEDAPLFCYEVEEKQEGNWLVVWTNGTETVASHLMNSGCGLDMANREA